MFSDIEPENPKFAAAQALALHLNEYVDPSGRFAFHPAEVVDRQSATAAIVSLLQLTHRLGPLTPADAEAVLATVHDAAKISPSLRPYVAAAINAGFFYMPHRTCFFLCCVLQALGIHSTHSVAASANRAIAPSKQRATRYFMPTKPVTRAQMAFLLNRLQTLGPSVR